jgi:uncharacterized protein (DUF302 family)
MRKLLLTCVFLFCFVPCSQAADGVVSVKSAFNVDATAKRLEAALTKKGMTIFARVDHAAGAARVGKKLRPTVLIIFGNPKVGTPLMQSSQIMGIDLPQKALIWEDESGQTWLSYNDPRYLAARHGVNNREAVLQKIEKALANFARQAATIKQ